METNTNIVINLLKLITSIKTTSNDVILFLKKYNIDSNIYLPYMAEDGEIPLLFYCCANNKYNELFQYLLNNNVNVHNKMNTKNPIDLLYYSQIEYIPTLISKNVVLSKETFLINGEKLLIGGNIKKLMLLYKYNAIDKNDLLTLIHTNNLLFNVLERLYERIFFICKNSNNNELLRSNYNDTIKNYSDVFKLILTNGVNINQLNNNSIPFMQDVLNTYIYDIIKVLLQYNPELDDVNLIHYSNFDLTNRQIMSFLYNKDNYENISNLLREYKIPVKINKKTIKKSP